MKYPLCTRVIQLAPAEGYSGAFGPFSVLACGQKKYPRYTRVIQLAPAEGYSRTTCPFVILASGQRKYPRYARVIQRASRGYFRGPRPLQSFGLWLKEIPSLHSGYSASSYGGLFRELHSGYSSSSCRLRPLQSFGLRPKEIPSLRSGYSASSCEVPVVMGHP